MATIRPEVTGRRARRAVPCETLAEETEEKIAKEDDTAEADAKSKRNRQPKPKQVPPGDVSKTIDQFCTAEQMSRPKYFKMRKLGLGPNEVRDGRFIRITPEAHAEWRRAREHEDPTT
jgi:hypothetical protein